MVERFVPAAQGFIDRFHVLEFHGIRQNHGAGGGL